MSTDKDVFLLPFAGGGSLVYNKWKLNNFIFHSIEYSGHGFRYREPMAQNMDEIVEDIILQIESKTYSDYFLFGHSMGGLLTWLVAQKIRKKPKVMFVSACEPPDCIKADTYKKYQDDDILMQYIKNYRRISEEQLCSKIFCKILFPVIQNDFRILSEYVYEPCAVLNVPIIVLCSKEDTQMRYRMMENWKNFSTDVHFEQLRGNHFYLEEEQTRKRILAIMENVMTSV